MFSFFFILYSMILFNKKYYFLSLSSERLLALRWCLGFAISFVVMLGFADLRPISLSPNVARDGTDPSLSRWSFVGLWWPVMGFCWSGGWVLLVCGGSCSGSRCGWQWVCCCDCWFCWWMVASCGCRWLWLRLVLIVNNNNNNNNNNNKIINEHITTKMCKTSTKQTFCSQTY